MSRPGAHTATRSSRVLKPVGRNVRSIAPTAITPSCAAGKYFSVRPELPLAAIKITPRASA